MSRTITAMFDDRAHADAAVQQLMQELNIERSATQVYAADTTSSATATTSAAAGDRGFWGSLKDLFVPDEDRNTYAEGVRRGGVVVSAKVDDDKLEHAMDILENNGAVDLDSREAEWKQSGWTAATPVDASSTVVGSSTTATGLGVVATGAVAGAAASTSRPSAPVATTAAMPATTPRVGGDEVIPIVEESLQIGKRDVERGRVRVRSFVTEIPVSEQVTLRDETVDVQRRKVDRPLTSADDAFRERTIEATETDQVAVVSKEARVVEELVVRKDTAERTETVKDSVRRTEVEVDDTTGASRTAGSVGLASTTAANPPGTMASRAVDKTLGTNVSGAKPSKR